MNRRIIENTIIIVTLVVVVGFFYCAHFKPEILKYYL